MKRFIKNSYLIHKETINDYLWRSLQVFGKQGITFLIFILCAKLLSLYDFGVYNYILAVVFFLIIFGDFGISTATSKYVAEYAVKDKAKLRGVLFNSGIIILFLTIIVALVTISIGPWYFDEKYIYVLYLLPIIFLAPMTSLYDGIYRGLKCFKKLAIISLIVGIIFIPIIYYSITTYGLRGALISQNIFYLFLLIGLSLGYKDFDYKWNKEILKEIGKYSLIIGTASIGYFMFSRVGILILERFNYIVEIGIYEISNKIIIIMLLPFSILCQVIAPRVTTSYYSKDKVKLKTTIKNYITLSFITGIVFSVLAFYTFPLFVNIFLKEYINTNILWIIKLFLIAFPTYVVSYILANGFSIYTGDASMNAKMLIIFGIINILFLPPILYYFGFKSFIYFTILIQIITNVVFSIYYLTKLFNKIR